MLGWELGTPLGRLADVRTALERYLIARGERWGRALRAAYVAAETGDFAAAAAALERAIHALRAREEDRGAPTYLAAALTVRDALSADAHETATERLRWLVEGLEEDPGDAPIEV